MDRTVWWAIAVKNSVCMICWTVLAVVFEKWWVALFACLCMTSVKIEQDSPNTDTEKGEKQ